ncbi:hypothetical protein CSO01_20680 [Cellulomonas soli]|uniref:Uncharacterized protein n=1 Tax=Cellulomonas soli TaxID=931535 RepID=A0A512PDS9_9CELL|nr:hypothetical protein CSO01_20680 [Cellulomonas soli]
MPAAVLEGLSVALSQSRSDWADRVVQVDVTDDGASAVEVVGVTLTAPTFSGQAVGERGRTVRPGTTRAVSVALGAPVCATAAASEPAAAASVTLLVRDEQGRESRLTLEPQDPRGHLARIHGEDCAAASVARGARLTVDDALDVQQSDGRLVAALTVRLLPVEGGPAVRVEQIDGSVLLAPPDGPAWSPSDLATDLATDLADDPGSTADERTAVLTFEPARCDAHAVAEDKRGTFLGVHATVDGVPVPVFYLPVTTQVRGQIHEYIGQACGWA